MDKKPFKINQSGGGNKRKRNFKNAGFVALLMLFGLIIFTATSKPNTLTDASYSDVIKRANNGEIAKIEIAGEQLSITKKGDTKPTEKSRKEAGSSIYEQGLKTDAP